MAKERGTDMNAVFDFGLDLLSQEGSSTVMGPAGSMSSVTSADVSSVAGKAIGYDAQPNNFKQYKSGAAKGRTGKKGRLRNRLG